MPLLVVLVLVVLLLLPLLLVAGLLAPWQRYRLGKRPRRVRPWYVVLNLWLLLAGSLFMLGWTALAQYWMADAWLMAVAGWLAGLVLGTLHVATSRHHRQDGQYHVTPNAWIVLALAVLVLARLLVVGWQLAEHGLDWRSHAQAAWYLRPASLFAVAALLLGHGLAWYWGLRRRLKAWRDGASG